MSRFFSIIALLSLFSSPARAEAFRFESIVDLSAMTSYIGSNFALGSPRENLRKIFVEEGGATLIPHPENKTLEKYIYDVNLCSWYVWRWNISALYDDKGRLAQAYMNGEPVFVNGPQITKFEKKTDNNGKMKISKITTPRPEASKGESMLASIVYDHDGDLNTLEDQELMGAGPSRSDPLNMGKMHVYKINSIWGSIFDHDKTKSIANYSGDCAVVDSVMEKAKTDSTKKKPQ